MPIAEIIDEIDAYLSRLRQAREFLLERIREAPQKRAPRRKKKVIVEQASPALSSRRGADENKSQSIHAIAHLKEIAKPTDASAQVPHSVARAPQIPREPAMIEPERTPQQSVVMTRLPAKEPRASTRYLRHRTATPPLSREPDKVKPPIALAGSMSSKVVVVSAEQVQREREQAARPAIRPPRTPSSGLTGKLAFEALFKDGTGPSNASGQ